MRTRAIQLLSLQLAVLLALTACNTGSKPREVHKVNWVNSPGYAAEDVPLPAPTADLKGCCTDGEYMYILADEKVEGQVRSVLSRVSLADGTAEVLNSYEPPQTPEGAFTNRLGPVMGADGTLWVYEAHTLMYFDFPEDYDPDTDDRAKYYTGQDDFHHLRQLDPATGKEKKLLDMSEAVRTMEIDSVYDVAGFAVDGAGNAYFAGKDGIAVTDSKGKLLFTLAANMPLSLTTNSAGGRLVLLPDGTVAALTDSSTPYTREVRTIDPEARDWGAERYAVPLSVDLVYNGTGGFLFFYTQVGELYAWEPEGESARRLLAWTETDLEGSVMCFAPLDGGKLAALTLQYTTALTDLESWYNGQLRVTLLSPSNKDPNAGKAKLIYGTRFADSTIRDRINQFNKNSDKYIIELREYGGMSMEEFYNLTFDEQSAALDAADQLFRAEVSSRKSPDLWDGSLDYYNAYARKGYLEDLWPWIDGDGELGGRDALMSHALECASIDGKLYSVASTFFISTMIARSDVVGGRTGWTLDELLDCWRQMPEGASIMSPDCDGSQMLDYLVRRDSSWVDWSTGECRFDSQAFKDILKLCRTVQESYDPNQEAVNAYTGLRDRQYLLESANLSGPSDLLYYEALCSGPEHIMDYGSYLNENGIYSSYTDEEGNRRDKDAILCDALRMVGQAKETGRTIRGLVAADAVYGALEGSGYAAFVGNPSPTRCGNSITLTGGGSASMSASCRHKEGAWEFIRQDLLPDATADRVYCFPVNKEAFEQRFEASYFQDASGEYLLDASGNRIEEPIWDLFPVPSANDGDSAAMVLFVMSPSEEQREAFMELYNSIEPSQVMDLDLMNIIQEQVQPYFAGDKSLDETADLIQRRASLYVNENR